MRVELDDDFVGEVLLEQVFPTAERGYEARLPGVFAGIVRRGTSVRQFTRAWPTELPASILRIAETRNSL